MNIRTLTIFNTALPPPPNDVHIIEESPSSNYIIFNWSEVSSSCPGLFYRTNILPQNCIKCPIIEHVTPNTTVTCTNYTEPTDNYSQCTFAVQTVICDGIAGNFSAPLPLNFTGIFYSHYI